MAYPPEFDRLAAEARMLLAREAELREPFAAADAPAAPRAAAAAALLSVRTRLLRISVGIGEVRAAGPGCDAPMAAADPLPLQHIAAGPLAELSAATAELERRYLTARDA